MLSFTVLHDSWHADGQAFAAGTHEITRPSKTLVRLAAHAHAAGAIEVREGLDESHVQTQDDAEQAHENARADGSWSVGNKLQQRLGRAQSRVGRAEDALRAADVDAAARLVDHWEDVLLDAQLNPELEDVSELEAELAAAKDRHAAAAAVDDDDRAALEATLATMQANLARVDAQVQRHFQRAERE